MASSLIDSWDDDDMETNWRDFTTGGTFENHDPIHGRALYAAEIYGAPVGTPVRYCRPPVPDEAGSGCAPRSAPDRAGGRLRGDHRYASTMSPQEYVDAVVKGTLSDPTAWFQLVQGFEVLGVVQHYCLPDPESLGYAAVIEWSNPDAMAAAAKQALVS